MATAREWVSDELWAVVEADIPVKPRRHDHPGRKRIADRKAFSGIVFVLKTGIQWQDLPQELGWGSGMTCWRRLHEWQAAGVWAKLHERLLAHLQAADQLDWSRAVVDSASVRAMRRGRRTGPNPTDRRKRGSKHHVLTDANGLPLAVRLSSANTNDISELLPLVDAVPSVRGKRGHPRRRPAAVYGDRAYDSNAHRAQLRRRKMEPFLGRRRVAHGSGLGRVRWVVERTLAWLHQFRRLRVRDERRDDIHEAFLRLGCVLICWRRLHRSFC